MSQHSIEKNRKKEERENENNITDNKRKERGMCG
jgi:hypothetical protein